MADRFYVSDLSTAEVILTDSEAHHALHVMRLKAGDGLQLFDGAGTSGEGVVKSTARSELTIEVLRTNHTPQRKTQRIIVAASPPKGDRLKWMVEKLTEIGVDEFVPLQTERCVVDPRKSKLDKLSQTVIAACKQSRRDWLMEISVPQRFDDLIESPPKNARVLIAHPDNDVSQSKSSEADEADVLVLIGPEGGFTDNEVARAKELGGKNVAWPEGILRTETAAIVFSTMLAATRNRPQP